jgi:hypothetical protein
MVRVGDVTNPQTEFLSTNDTNDFLPRFLRTKSTLSLFEKGTFQFCDPNLFILLVALSLVYFPVNTIQSGYSIKMNAGSLILDSAIIFRLCEDLLAQNITAEICWGAVPGKAREIPRLILPFIFGRRLFFIFGRWLLLLGRRLLLLGLLL